MFPTIVPLTRHNSIKIVVKTNDFAIFTLCLHIFLLIVAELTHNVLINYILRALRFLINEVCDGKKIRLFCEILSHNLVANNDIQLQIFYYTISVIDLMTAHGRNKDAKAD